MPIALPPDAGETAAVEVRGLVKKIDEHPILRGIDFSIRPGEYVAILGANGAGKTTLLRILASLIPATAGEIKLFGQPLNRGTTELRRQIGLIGHQSMLYRDLSARENLEFFANLYGLTDPAARVQEMLDRTGLPRRADDPVKSLSRGMVQRIAIARALLHDPQIILADEAFDGLDAPSTRALEQLFAAMTVNGKTILLVNHDIEQTLRIAERAIVVRGGRIVIDQPTYRLYAEEVLAEVSES